MTIPIFIITYNRLDVLKKTYIEAMKLSGDYVIVFCDNNSTYTHLIDWLKEKETNHKVYWNKTSNLYNEIENTVNAWYSENDSEYFMIMDPDVVLECPPDVIDLLKYILDTNKNV